ncbi:hypothetical protein SPI_00079 [Niveomyces insectorum RCEF 264]|uniref:Uncharacterized protein n=1 Tax=Niveomyces insectorum RCEF 264 TaxID=1081102 RepID=A0A167ZT99_9HYPO|nr:hypothetical protein SPI_00079 [Niveomyces insectorum RCEF 264]
MIRLSPTVLFVSMDEVKEYETRYKYPLPSDAAPLRSQTSGVQLEDAGGDKTLVEAVAETTCPPLPGTPRAVTQNEPEVLSPLQRAASAEKTTDSPVGMLARASPLVQPVVSSDLDYAAGIDTGHDDGRYNGRSDGPGDAHPRHASLGEPVQTRHVSLSEERNRRREAERTSSSATPGAARPPLASSEKPLFPRGKSQQAPEANAAQVVPTSSDNGRTARLRTPEEDASTNPSWQLHRQPRPSGLPCAPSSPRTTDVDPQHDSEDERKEEKPFFSSPKETDYRDSFRIYDDSLPASNQPQTPQNRTRLRFQSRVLGAYTAPAQFGGTCHVGRGDAATTVETSEREVLNIFESDAPSEASQH